MSGALPKGAEAGQEIVYERFPYSRPPGYQSRFVDQDAAGGSPVQSSEEARQRAARIRSRRVGRPLLGPSGTRQNADEIRTKLGAG